MYLLIQLDLVGAGGAEGTDPCNIELVLTLDEKYPSSKIGVKVTPRDGVSGTDAGTLHDQLNILATSSVSRSKIQSIPSTFHQPLAPPAPRPAALCRAAPRAPAAPPAQLNNNPANGAS